MVQISNRRLLRADARRLAILRAAARTFRAVGFAAAGMRDIAAAADLSPGNLYHYFRGKDELLFFCQRRTLDQLLAALDRARRAHGPLTKRLHTLAVAHVLCVIDDVEGSVAHLEVSALPPRLRTMIIAKRDKYERGVRALVEDGVRRGALDTSNPAVATRAFLGALNWTAYWFRPDGTQPPGTVAEHVAAFAVAGLTSHDTRTHRVHSQRRTNGGRVRAVQDVARSAS